MLITERHGPITRIRMARTFLGRPLFEVSAYLLEGGLLIDTGCPATARELTGWCRSRGIRWIVNTHHHEDHVGGNCRLSADLGLVPLAPPAAVPILRAVRPLPLYRQLVWGQPQSCQASELDDVFEEAGYRLLSVPTPGHAPDHTVLFEPVRGWLFSADLYVHWRVTYARRRENIHLQMASLRRAIALQPRTLLCAHAGVVEDAGEALNRKLEFWESLARRATELAATGCSLRSITRRLLGREGVMTWASSGDFSKKNLIRSLVEDRPEG